MTEVAASPTTYQLFIAGRWVSGVSGRTFESRNPADTREVIGRFQAGTPPTSAGDPRRRDGAARAGRRRRRRSAARSCTASGRSWPSTRSDSRGP